VEKPGMKNILMGAVLMALGYLLKDQFNEWGAGFLYYVIEIAGLVIFIMGLRTFFQENGKSDDDRTKAQTALRNEVLLKTLARMTYADSNTKAVEVKAVRKIYKKATGLDVLEPDIRVAARGDLHETKGFSRYLAGVRDKISLEDKIAIIKAMGEVVKADGSVSPAEVIFFDEVGKAFKLNPSEIVNLK